MKTITLEQARERIQYFEQIKVYKPITLLKKISGLILIGYGVITIWNPISGSIWTIMLGCALMGIDYKKLLNTINFYSKETVYWVLRLVRRMTK